MHLPHPCFRRPMPWLRPLVPTHMPCRSHPCPAWCPPICPAGHTPALAGVAAAALPSYALAVHDHGRFWGEPPNFDPNYITVHLPTLTRIPSLPQPNSRCPVLPYTCHCNGPRIPLVTSIPSLSAPYSLSSTRTRAIPYHRPAPPATSRLREPHLCPHAPWHHLCPA